MLFSVELDAVFTQIVSSVDDRDRGPDTMSLMHFATLADLLGVDVDSEAIYLLAWKMECKYPLCIQRREWNTGIRNLRLKTMADVSNLVAQTQKALLAEKVREDSEMQLQTGSCASTGSAPHGVKGGPISPVPVASRYAKCKNAPFRSFYEFIFEWARSSTERRALECETAMELWSLVFPKYKSFTNISSWLTFFKTEYRRKDVSRDLWGQLLEFSGLDSYDSYDPNGAWPTTMDDFVAWRAKAEGMLEDEARNAGGAERGGFGPSCGAVLGHLSAGSTPCTSIHGNNSEVLSICNAATCSVQARSSHASARSGDPDSEPQHSSTAATGAGPTATGVSSSVGDRRRGGPPSPIPLPEGRMFACVVTLLGEAGSGKSTFRQAIAKVAARTRVATDSAEGSLSRSTFVYRSVGKRRESVQVSVIEEGSGLPLRSGVACQSLAFSNTILLFLPLSAVKQRTTSLAKRFFAFAGGGDAGTAPAGGAGDPPVLIHAQDVQLLWRLLSCAVAFTGQDGQTRAPNVFLLCTFKDLLSESSNHAVELVLAHIRKLCTEMLSAMSSIPGGGGLPAQLRRPRRSPNATEVSPQPSLLGIFALDGITGSCVPENKGGPTNAAEVWSLVCDISLKDAVAQNMLFGRPAFTLHEWNAAMRPNRFASYSASRSSWNAAIAEGSSKTHEALPHATEAVRGGAVATGGMEGEVEAPEGALCHEASEGCGVQPGGSGSSLGDPAHPSMPTLESDVHRGTRYLAEFIRRAKHDKGMVLVSTRRLMKVAYSVGLTCRAHLEAVLRSMEVEGELLHLRHQPSHIPMRENTICLHPRVASKVIQLVAQLFHAAASAKTPPDAARALSPEVSAAVADVVGWERLVLRGALPARVLFALAPACVRPLMPRHTPSEQAEVVCMLLVLTDFMFPRWAPRGRCLSSAHHTDARFPSSAMQTPPASSGRLAAVAGDVSSMGEPFSCGSSSRTFLPASAAAYSAAAATTSVGAGAYSPTLSAASSNALHATAFPEFLSGDDSEPTESEASAGTSSPASVEYIIPSLVVSHCVDSVYPTCLALHHRILSDATPLRQSNSSEVGATLFRVFTLQASPPDLFPVLMCRLHPFLPPDGQLFAQTLWLQNGGAAPPLAAARRILNAVPGKPTSDVPHLGGPTLRALLRLSAGVPPSAATTPEVDACRTRLECFFFAGDGRDTLALALFAAKVVQIIEQLLRHRYPNLSFAVGAITPSPACSGHTPGSLIAGGAATTSTLSALCAIDTQLSVFRTLDDLCVSH